jgi:ribonuclease H / adenosylcobalamin/alpha-ribazole phosphatase
MTAPSPATTELRTVRHGLTELNRDRRVGGHTDAPLIDEGRAQAEEARERFTGTPFDVVISSPLSRARETAAIVTGLRDDQLIIDEECVERSFGLMEGLHGHEVAERFPDVRYLEVDGVRYSLDPPGGEPFEALHQRAAGVAARLLEQHRGRRILLFAHQNFLQQLHGVLLGLGPLEALQHDILNCELNEFVIDGDGALRSHRVEQLCLSASQFPSF